MTEDEREGTTLVGVVADDGVVVASDRQMTSATGMRVEGEKLFEVHPNSVIGTTGVVGPCQKVAELSRKRIQEYEAKRGRQMSAENALNRVSKVMQSRFDFLFTRLLFGGFDGNSTILAEVGALGSVITHDDFMTLGSGNQVARGVIESRYEPSVSVDEAHDIAVAALKATAEHRIYTGYSADVAEITEDGVQIYRRDEDI